MRYSFAAILALASAVFAQTEGFDVISKPGNYEKVPAASTYTIVWAPKPEHTGTVTLSLIGGKDQQNLFPISTLGKAQNSDGKFEWKVAENLGDKAIYGVVITWDQDKEVFQYSFPFNIAGAGAGAGHGSGFPSATGSTPGGSNSTVTKTGGPTIVTSSSFGNLSTSATGGLTTLISATPSPSSSRTSTAAGASSTAAAPRDVASTLALFGGLAMAIFAL